MIKAYTSRFRYDERSRYTGVYQQMGRPGVDADWNEEVRLRTIDARRRTDDLAHGSPDDGFVITRSYLLDPILSLNGWEAQDPPLSDDRVFETEGRLDRREAECLPFVLRTRGHIGVQRTLARPVDLTAVPVANDASFAADAVVFEVRFERPPTDDEEADVEVLLIDGNGVTSAVSATLPVNAADWPTDWIEIRVPVADFGGGIDLTDIAGWGARNLPPRATTWVAALRCTSPDLGDDVVIRGGDGTVTGAGRMLLEGVRVFQESDLHYSAQPDYPSPPPLGTLDDDHHHFFFLDVFEDTSTFRDDSDLADSALDGLDTTARLRIVQQVRARQGLTEGQIGRPPSPTGGGRLTTAIRDSEPGWTDRSPPEPFDPCRDRCLFTDNRATGVGYLGSDNVHVRVELFRAPTGMLLLWSRDNASSVYPLLRRVEANASTLELAPVDAGRLRAGDLIVIEDDDTTLQPDEDLVALSAAEAAARRPRLVRVLRSNRANGVVEIEEPNTLLVENDPITVDVGGPVGRVFDPARGAQVRRWDGADALVTDARYRLEDNITFGVRGDGFRAGDFWTFTARILAPDGASEGVVQRLDAEVVHGPVHHYVPLALAFSDRIEDIRPRYLPLKEVKDRLEELGDREFGPAVFTVVVGDGVSTFGDVDQNLAEGVSGDEALQVAVDRVGPTGGTIYIRRGTYRLDHPVLLRRVSAVRILGDGDSTRLRVQGAGGGFYLDNCGRGGELTIERLSIVEAPEEEVVIGNPRRRPRLPPRDLLARIPFARVRPTIPPSLVRFVELPSEPFDGVLAASDLATAVAAPTFVDRVGTRIRELNDNDDGRAATSVVGTLIALRRLQRENPGSSLEDIAAAMTLLDLLRRVPHGVITVADSFAVSLHHVELISLETRGTPSAFMVTGTCGRVRVDECRLRAETGILAIPYAPYFSRAFIERRPRAGFSIDGFEIENCTVEPHANALHGVRVDDGEVRGLVIDNNRVGAFVVGLSLRDRSEAWGAPDDRARISNNRVVATQAIGIEVEGDGVVVESNAIEPAATDGPFSAAIQVTGHGIVIRESWIALPSTPDAPVLGEVAGIVIGDGVDDEFERPRTVYNVTVESNHIEGQGAATLATGILVGGAQPIFEVTLRGNVVRNLGGAGVRVLGTGADVGALRIEDNRIAQVALAGVAAFAETMPTLDRLSPRASTLMSAQERQRPSTLIRRLIEAPRGRVRGALDGALRWAERLTLRGGIVVAGAEDVTVRRNDLARIGTVAPYDTNGLDASEIRMAGIATAGGTNIVVDDNRVEEVRAPVETDSASGVVPPSLQPRPPLVAAIPPTMALETLGAIEIERRIFAVSRKDLNGATIALRRALTSYVPGDTDIRTALTARIAGPVRSLVSGLERLGGRGEELAVRIDDEWDRLTKAARPDDALQSAITLNAAISDAAAYTSSDDRATRAWVEAARLDAVVQEGGDALATAATQIREGLDVLGADTPRELITAADLALTLLVRRPSPEAIAAADNALTDVALHLSVSGERKKQPDEGAIVGTKKAVVGALSTELGKAAQALEREDPGRVTRTTVTGLRDAKSALVGVLADTHPALGRSLEVDFATLDRVDGPAPEAVDRFRATLKKIDAVTSGEADGGAVDGADRTRAATEADRALVHLYVAHLDDQILGLAEAPEASAQSRIRELSTGSKALLALASESADATILAERAVVALQRAAAEPERRKAALGEARDALDLLRQRYADVAPIEPELTETERVSEEIEARIAGVAALALSLPELDATSRPRGFTALAENFDRIAVGLEADATTRAQLDEAVRSARAAFEDGGDPERAVHLLTKNIVMLSGRARELSDDATSPQLDAIASLTQASALVTDPDDPVDARRARLATFVGSQTDYLAPSLVAELSLVPSILNASQRIRELLERLARKERPERPTHPAPIFDTRVEPSFGVFVAGPTDRAEVTSNEIRRAAIGISVTGLLSHALTEQDEHPGVVLRVDRNTVVGCAVGGLVIDLDVSAIVFVDGNEISSCAGLAVDPVRTRAGRSVVEISGGGDLAVTQNTLVANGHDHPDALLHEIFVDWRGNTVVRGNRVRHVGGRRGGTAVVIRAGNVGRDVLDRLSTLAFLAVDPPPLVKPAVRLASPTTMTLIASALPTKFAMAQEDTIEVGALTQRIALTPSAHRALEVSVTKPARAEAARLSALGYLQPSATVLPGLLGSLRPPQVFVPRPLPPPVGSVVVENNDIAAAGPCLLVAADPRAVVSATVVGNELRSAGATGALYLRDLDSVVMSSNRLFAAGAVTVAVIRVGRAPISLVGNVLLGKEPVVPFVVRPVPLPKPVDGPVLTLPIGGGATVAAPLDVRGLLGSLEKKRASSKAVFADVVTEFVMQQRAGVATETASLRLLDATLATAVDDNPEPSNDVAAVRTNVNRLLGVLATRRPDLSATIESARPVITTSSDRASATPEARTAVLSTMRAVFEPTTGYDTRFATLETLVGRVTNLVDDDEKAKATIKRVLTEANGDPVAALKLVDEELLGIDSASPTVRASLATNSVLHEVLSDALYAARAPSQIAVIPPRFRPRPRPAPYARSLVVLGGTKVAIIGNATTAGVYASGADTVVELNP